MNTSDRELKSTLAGQQFGSVENHARQLDEAMGCASAFARVTGGIAVLSDFSRGKCHTYSGRFGQNAFSLPEYTLDDSSPFEDVIFDRFLNEDLIGRHILELRFFHFLHSLPVGQHIIL